MRLRDGRQLCLPWTPGRIYAAAALGLARVTLPNAAPPPAVRNRGGVDPEPIWPEMPDPRRQRRRRRTEPMLAVADEGQG